VRRTLLEIDPQKPAHGVERLVDLLGATYARDTRAAQLILAFAASACLLSALGIYGLLAYRVRQRATEIGVRLALGASRGRIVSWVAREAMRLLLIGAVLGLAAAWVAARLLGGLLYGVAPGDPMSALAALGLLSVTGLFASGLPAWRATRVDPATVLRQG
jgi:putative ABC transport system permease protein